MIDASGPTPAGRERMRIKMQVKGLMVDPVTNMPMVILRGDPGSGEGEPYVLPIWVGIFEANAIALQVENIETPRPMTHDLLRSVIERLGGRVLDVVVCDLRDNTFYAVVNIEVEGEGGRQVVAVDARPSDAIALALRVGADIYVDEEVVEKAKAFDVGSENPEKLRAWFESLSSDDLGHYEM